MAPTIASEASAAGLSGTPEVIDGDTIVVAGETVRLFGIDAPEMGQNCAIGARTYDCGAVSRTALLDLTAGTPVTCELMKGATSADSPEGKPGRCFAAGYDLRTVEAYAETMAEFDRILGLDLLRCFHLNDSKKGLGSRVDRHQHIGQGLLGLEPFRLLLNDHRFATLPGLLETPKGAKMLEDVENLRLLRSLVSR